MTSWAGWIPDLATEPTAGAPERAGVAVGSLSVAGTTLHARCEDAVREALGPDVRVICTAPEEPDAALRQVLAEVGDPARRRPVDAVLVLDPTHALMPPATVAAVVAAAGPEAVVVVTRPVTDTLKSVDRDGRVLATVDRLTHRHLLGPVALPAAVLASLAEAGAWPRPGRPFVERLVAACRAVGAAVVAVPGPPHLVLLTSAEDLVLAPVP